jgi:hypothetical protein
MNQIATEKHSIKPAKASLADYGDIDQDNGRHPTRVFKKNISEKLESIEYEQEAKALRWALNRLAGWVLPGKEHAAEYFQHMHRRNLRPKTYISNLTAIQIFLTVVKDSGKTHL